MKNILVIEDDSALGKGICLALQGDELSPLLCGSLQAAKAALLSHPCSLVILDVNLPDGSGLDFLVDLRRRSSVPVLLLTANDLETDIVTGLELGADDYVTKPFSLAVLRARVNAQLRKISDHAADCYVQDDFHFDFGRMEFWRSGAPVELSKTEQKLLRLLVENRGATLPRALLTDRIWPDGAAYVDENALSVTIKRLRDKLEASPAHPSYIKTVYGIGYTWAVAP